ncbi:MAG: RtcB family protein [Planctomycetota bacterium]|jgi:tRNA-splicing ligase RtcB
MPSVVDIERLDAWRWRIPRHGGMRTDGLVFASEALMDRMQGDRALEQVRNVAHLPGIVGPSLGMPDLHWGYGFAIGGVAAFDPEKGVISPGGVGYDINCGVRLLRTDVSAKRVARNQDRLADALYEAVPCGTGSRRKDVVLGPRELGACLRRGATWAVERGYGGAADIEHTEENGHLEGARPDLVSDRAKQRGRNQLGTLGSGNHFLEVDRVAEVFDPKLGEALGLEEGKVAVLIHTGSRGFGHQVCTDYLPLMKKAARKYGIALPDPQLACAPFRSEEGQAYFGAMRAAVNFAFANRQLVAHYARRAFQAVFGDGLGMRQVYDVCHNIAKVEEHEVGGRRRQLVVHRKGATRAFPPGHPLTPAAYREVGQPVMVPGDMGRYSYVLVGTEGAWRETMGSCCHGAGRVQSRTKAKAATRHRNIPEELKERGITIRAASRRTVDEEYPEAYKDVSDVVDVVHGAGIARLAARLEPMCVVKG